MQSPMRDRDENGQDSGSRKRSQSGHAPQNSVHKQRREKYAMVACDECKKKKVKCSGHMPCQRCDSYEKACKYSRGFTDGQEAVQSSSTRCTVIEAELRILKEQVRQLQSSLEQITTRQSEMSITAFTDTPPTRTQEPGSQHARSQTRSRDIAAPTRSRYLGPTSSEFSFGVAKSTLHKLGIQSEESDARLDSAVPSRRASPEPPSQEVSNTNDPLLSLGLTEVRRALDIYNEELHSIYPFINVDEMILEAPNIYQRVETSYDRSSANLEDPANTGARDIDVMIMKMMIATALVVEGAGQSNLGDDLLCSVEEGISKSTKAITIDLKQLQLFTLTSIYHFHCDEDVLAWRTIGIAARIALEMGLHRRESLEANVPDLESRHWATRLFYCIYVLDRRWSFGTGMPFALHESDIDPDLPHLNGRAPYLDCMVLYGRLSSKVWEAMAAFGNKKIDTENIGYLDFQLQQWQQSIPKNLQLSVSDIKPLQDPQSRGLQRLQVLLYLRANHMRILLHRRNILSTLGITNDLPGAHLVTDIAKDTIRLLVRLRESSTIYETQQNSYNYFLVSALSAIFLAVCHAPAEFSISCRDEFFSALGLLKDLSSYGFSAKRLWKRLRGLKNIAPKLGLTPRDEVATVEEAPDLPLDRSRHTHLPADSIPSSISHQQHTINSLGASEGEAWLPNPGANVGYTPDGKGSLPDMFQMSNDLTDIFEALGDMNDPGNTSYNFQEASAQFRNGTEISMLFGDLL